ncbi:MAG: helix-turn-helix domain-containing protein [Bacillota bacterium]|nr:helix-turn-helix domain-containing protein [Bacillota bacterium]
MPYIEIIILYCLKQLNGERTIYSIYHLLKGKKSSQTIQDAHLYKLTHFFRCFESISREVLETKIQKFLGNHWIVPNGDQQFLVTSVGEQVLTASLEKQPFPKHLDGWKYHSESLLFWERFSLLVQVISNFNFKEAHYIPIQKNKQVHRWLKLFLKENSWQKNSLGKILHSELMDCFESAQNINPAVFIFRLTGYCQIGLTPLQVAEKLKIETTKYYIEFQNIIHFLIQHVRANPIQYKLLSSIILDIKESNPLTHSSKITYEYVRKGLSIQEIAKTRGLKTSTIEDHIVEIALNIDGFSIDSFIDKGIQKKIIAVANRTETKQLKLIKKHIDTANYFEIRLVLAKFGGVKQ